MIEKKLFFYMHAPLHHHWQDGADGNSMQRGEERRAGGVCVQSAKCRILIIFHVKAPAPAEVMQSREWIGKMSVYKNLFVLELENAM